MLNNGDWLFEVSCTEYSQNETRDNDRVRAVTMMVQTVRELGFTGPMREIHPSGLPVVESQRVLRASLTSKEAMSELNRIQRKSERIANTPLPHSIDELE